MKNQFKLLKCKELEDIEMGMSLEEVSKIFDEKKIKYTKGKFRDRKDEPYDRIFIDATVFGLPADIELFFFPSGRKLSHLNILFPDSSYGIDWDARIYKDEREYKSKIDRTAKAKYEQICEYFNKIVEPHDKIINCVGHLTCYITPEDLDYRICCCSRGRGLEMYVNYADKRYLNYIEKMKRQRKETEKAKNERRKNEKKSIS